MSRRVTVKVHYGPYTSTETISADENEDNETIIARVWARLNRQGWLTLPMAYRSAKIIEDIDDCSD